MRMDGECGKRWRVERRWEKGGDERERGREENEEGSEGVEGDERKRLRFNFKRLANNDPVRIHVGNTIYSLLFVRTGTHFIYD